MRLTIGTSTATPPTEVKTYYHSDLIGSIRAITDAAGNLSTAARHDYYAFGEEHPQAQHPNALPTGERQRFAGKQVDPETYLQYFEARYFANRTGRFTSADPVFPEEALVMPQMWHRYAYALNNPLRFVDPTGLEPESQQSTPYTLGYNGPEEPPTELMRLAGELEGYFNFFLGIGSRWLQLAQQHHDRSLQLFRDRIEVEGITVSYGAMPGPPGLRLAMGGGLAAGSRVASSRLLAQALQAAGRVRPPHSAAHHIVAGNDHRAAAARAVLDRFGISINGAANNVFLPASSGVASGAEAAVHSSLHTSAYYQAVNQALGAATTREQAVAILKDIGGALLGGRFPW